MRELVCHREGPMLASSSIKTHTPSTHCGTLAAVLTTVQSTCTLKARALSKHMWCTTLTLYVHRTLGMHEYKLAKYI